MITPIKSMTISQIVARQDDLLVSVDDVKELAKNERADAIDEINKAEDTLIKCFKKENEIWTIRMAFAELREHLLEEET